jgi:hypothetical protein
MRKSGLEPIRQFYLTSIAGLYAPVDKTIDFINQIENSLVENIDLKKYGEGLREVNFIYLVRAAKDDKFGEYKRYSRLKKFVDFQLKIDEEDFIAASDENALGMMAELFLKSILLYKELKIKNFDDICFYNDVKKLFIEKKLMANTDKVEIK